VRLKRCWLCRRGEWDGEFEDHLLKLDWAGQHHRGRRITEAHLLRASVARSCSRVRKLCILWPSAVIREAAFRFATTETFAAATGEIGEPPGFAGQQAVYAEFARHAENRGNRSVRQRALDLDRFGGGEVGAALEDVAQGLDFAGWPMRQVGDGSRLDLIAVTVALAPKHGGGRGSVGDDGNIHVRIESHHAVSSDRLLFTCQQTSVILGRLLILPASMRIWSRKFGLVA
jgi:hypothetical protein